MELEGIILAAGFSTRTGVFKPLLPVEGLSMLERCIMGMDDVCAGIIVVTGFDKEKIAPLLSKYTKVKMTFNPQFTQGMFSSVLAGVKQIKAERFFLCPGDYPLISKSVYERMLRVDADIVLPAFGGRLGHPVLIKSSLISDLTSQKCKSLKEYIDYKGFIAVEVGEPGILIDVDTLKDYQKVLKMLQTTF